MLTSQDDIRPALRIREVTLGDPFIAATQNKISPLGDRTNSITDRIYQKYAIENWSESKLRTYIDMLHAFGFNSVQLYDQWQSYVCAGWGNDPRDWPEKVDALADYAHTKSMGTTLFIWGNAAFDHHNKTRHMHLCWNDPHERKILEQHWDHQSRHATHFDRIVTHWADPGGCNRNGCTIETAQHLHNQILKRFRAKNHAIESSFSLWMLHSREYGKWEGYEGPQSVLESGILPHDVMIAVHSSPDDGCSSRYGGFEINEVTEIAAAGRKVGVWAWYLADNEIAPSFIVRTKALHDYFSNVPADMYELIERHSLDSTSHGLNMHNLYVAGKLMRDPYADAQAVLREFIAGALGRENVENVQEVFFTIEALRKGFMGVPEGTVDAARRAHDLARGVLIPKGFSPAFPMIISPEELAGELTAQTEAITEFLVFREASADLERMTGQGASEARVNAAIANLPRVKTPSMWLTNLEYCAYLAGLDELKKALRRQQ